MSTYWREMVQGNRTVGVRRPFVWFGTLIDSHHNNGLWEVSKLAVHKYQTAIVNKVRRR